jgi:hypothetical protein
VTQRTTLVEARLLGKIVFTSNGFDLSGLLGAEAKLTPDRCPHILPYDFERVVAHPDTDARIADYSLSAGVYRGVLLRQLEVP